MRLAILTSHPIQYNTPIFRELAARLDLVVFFAHKATRQQQAAAGFGVEFEWDLDLLSGYQHVFLDNVAADPGVHHFHGCDTPSIGAHLSKDGFDALLVTGWNLKCYWQGIFAGKRRGLRVLARGDSHLRTKRALATRLVKGFTYPTLLNQFDAALYVGKHNRAYWRAYGYPQERLYFSPHCVDTAFFSERATPEARASLRAKWAIPKAAHVALFAGRLVDFKRPLDLIRAAARLRQRGLDVHVVIAGSGELQDTIQTAARHCAVPTQMLGFQNQSQLPAIYAACDALVLPSSDKETWGLVANEALACRRPVLVSDACGCAPDLTQFSTAAKRFPVGDVAALAQTLADTMLSAPALHDLNEVNTCYSVSKAASGIEDAVSDMRLTLPVRH